MFFPDWLPTLYNALWTSWPCMFTFMFDIDVGKEMTLKNPVFFEAGHKRTYFNFRVFWVYLSKALIHGILWYYIPLLGLGVVTKIEGSIEYLRAPEDWNKVQERIDYWENKVPNWKQTDSRYQA